MSQRRRQAICASRAESTSWNPWHSIPNSTHYEDSFMAKTQHKKKARGASTESVRIGIIGGSGLYNMPGLEKPREMRVKTPFGNPSDVLVVGTIEGKRVAFLARHARGHRFLPTEINYRANIHAMKQLGVERIVSVSAVGSLQEDLKPLDFLIPDQFYDRTRHRVSTFFGDGVAAHVGFAKPVCSQLTTVLGEACDRVKVRVHRGGTYICMEGPQFSTLDEIISNLNKNAENAQAVVREAVRAMPPERACKCGSALAHAIVTDPAVISAAARKRLSVIAGKYFTRGAH